ncbi:hypothetical protein A1O1_07305 [Capronia coronata CBS 617.96]|uniref:Uncharacterized protein n=1 Tax=Capronia coronata CBS 617.96 TaxID=1182541 RepID=W9Y358_9EURO|nr:uncharacterized protein A1O1_07305 [Capronia coronata CBS 617.96]EXJ83681.1 hypothetical protein A1O1_07305 [Capronia coronata CBS 617.96]
MGPPDNDGFTHISSVNGPETTNLDSLASSLESEFTQTTGAARTGLGASSLTRSSTASETSSASAAATASSGSRSAAATASTSSTTFTTSVTAVASSSLNDLASTTATNAASNTSGAVTVSHSSCHSISCSSGLKAAIAVPVVVAALAGIFLFFFCARRRRRRNLGAGAVVSEKQPKKAGKKWSRHLRAFSFDAELLMGGRFSSTNSIRSRDASVRSGAVNSNTAAQSTEPSLHSIEEEVAPPYRDAISHAQHPVSPSHLRSIGALGSASADPIPRPLSTSTAPPPYGSIVRETRAGPPTPVSATNPFADSAPVSPIEGSPFNDPPDDGESHVGGARTPLSRGSSLYQSVSTDDGSDAASIRQAQVGRRVSARTTDNSGSGSGGGGNTG